MDVIPITNRIVSGNVCVKRDVWRIHDQKFVWKNNRTNQGCGAGAGAGPFWPNWSQSHEIAMAPALDQALKMAYLTVESM